MHSAKPIAQRPLSPPHNEDVHETTLPTFRRKLKNEWPSLLRHGLQVCAFNTVVAIVQIVMGHEPHWDNEIVYSQSIGLSIWALIDFGRLFFTRDSDGGWPRGRRGWALTVGGIVGGFIIGANIGDLYSGGSTFAGLSLMSGKTRQLLGSVGATLVAGTIGTTFFYSRSKAQYLRAQAAATERDLAETRLKLLESQLEPHMLFNTLANLRVLIALDPDRAQAMLDRLIAFLRATLSASRAATHPLRDEFARVDDYLSLMKVRMGERLCASLTLPDDLAGVSVPSLLLQPLVENAI
ncbi:MAG: sensor histidine kinase [Rhizobacter sp.]|nr:sensor histidine kinase [Rhizobacter sp.]